jgi:heme exporter protein B
VQRHGRPSRQPLIDPIVQTAQAVHVPTRRSEGRRLRRALATPIAALTLGGLLLVPITIPLLIFGAGTLSENPGNAMQLLAATALAITALSPFAAGAALRAGRT